MGKLNIRLQSVRNHFMSGKLKTIVERNHFDFVREILDSFAEGDIVVADRYYASYFLIAELQSRGVDVVMQQHAVRRTDFRKGWRLDTKDHVVDWHKPARPKWMDPSCYELLPDSLSIRELQVGKKVLVATLLSNKAAPRKQLGDLYKDRC